MQDVTKEGFSFTRSEEAGLYVGEIKMHEGARRSPKHSKSQSTIADSCHGGCKITHADRSGPSVFRSRARRGKSDYGLVVLLLREAHDQEVTGRPALRDWLQEQQALRSSFAAAL